MNAQTMIEALLASGGFSTEGRARAALDATLRVLGQRLSPIVAKDIARALPEELGAQLLSTEGGEDFSVDQFYWRVAAEEDSHPGMGLEYAQAVGQVLYQSLPEEKQNRLLKDLPADWAPVFEREGVAQMGSERPKERGENPAFGRPLATAHSPSRSPLSEGGSEILPSGGIAHTNSIAERDNPHAERKISSVTEEPEHSLSDSRPAGEED